MTAIGRSFLILCAFLLIPLSLHAADDMWSSVYVYQKKLAEHGRPEAQIKLGEMYEEGHGVEKSYDTAEAWYRKALAQQHSQAQEKIDNLNKRRHHEKLLAERELLAEQKRIKEQKRIAEKASQEEQRREKVRKQRALVRAKQRNSESDKKRMAALAKRESQLAKKEAELAKKEKELKRQKAAEAIEKMLAAPGGYDEE